jgi:RHS repeat-associated protein
METTAAGVATAYYVYGLGLISREDATTYKSYHYDLRGSTLKLTNSTGTVTDSYLYGPYGELASSTGTTANPFKYNGRDGVMTEPNGLYYMRARYYLPEARRFISRDTLLGSVDQALTLNRFAYVSGNPVGFVDPSGMKDSIAFDPFSQSYNLPIKELPEAQTKGPSIGPDSGNGVDESTDREQKLQKEYAQYSAIYGFQDAIISSLIQPPSFGAKILGTVAGRLCTTKILRKPIVNATKVVSDDIIKDITKDIIIDLFKPTDPWKESKVPVNYKPPSRPKYKQHRTF